MRVALKVTPRAAEDRIAGIAQDADGRAVIKVSVTAAPDRGKANQAVIRLLAKTWRIPKTRIEIVTGVSDRRKGLHIAGEPTQLLQQLSEWANGNKG